MLNLTEYTRLRNWHQRAYAAETLPALREQLPALWLEKERLETLYRVRDRRQQEHYKDAFYEAWAAALAVASRIASIERHMRLLDEWEG